MNIKTYQKSYPVILMHISIVILIIKWLFVVRGSGIEDNITAEFKSKLQDDIRSLKWQEEILDKQLEVICYILY